MISARREVAALVSECRRVWSQSGAAIVDDLQPRLADAEMDALTGSLGLRLPDELRGWWGQHNGVSRESGGSMYTFNRATYEPLGDAVVRTQISRAIAEEMRDDLRELGLPNYRPTFLTVMALPHCHVVCDCASRDLAPVYCHWPEQPWRLERPILPRFGDLLRWWLEAHQAGAYDLVNEAGHMILLRVKDVAPERLATGVM